ncbi:MAG: PH domain-containing protein, partial [Eggerthellaceae bacterium]|nr:PH domain-containing protein [Eggerthellaceae bacterium]
MMSALTVGAGEQPEKHRVHHSYIWLGGLRIVFVILFASAVSMGSSLIGGLAGGAPTPEDFRVMLIIFGVCALVVLLVVALVMVYQVVSYKHLWYELGEEEFSLYSGIFSKKRVHVPYRRIQSVDQRATLLQRVFGVCSVSIDTAGGSNNKAVQVPYVQKAQAEQLRATLYRYAAYYGQGGDSAHQASRAFQNPGIFQTPGAFQVSGPSASFGNVLDAPAGLWDEARGVFAGESVDTGRVTYEYGLTNKELVLTGLSNNTAFVLMIVGILGVVSQVVGQVIPMLLGDSSPLINAALNAGMRLFGDSLLVLAMAFTVGAVVFLWLLSAAASCISYGGFRCCRRGSRIEVERGLLQHQFQGVNVDRVQSVAVKQTFIRRLFGYCEISLGKIDAASENADGQQQASLQQGLVIHPFVKMSRVPEILAGIVPEFSGVPVDVRPVPPVAKRRAVIRRAVLQGGGFWLALLVALFQVPLNVLAGHAGADAGQELLSSLPVVNMVAVGLYALAAVLLALDVVGALLWHRDSGFAFNRKFMQISNGGFSRETVSFPRQKIQFGYTSTNPFQRRAHTASLHVRTAAGVGGTTVRLVDADREDAIAWLEWLKPRGNMV